MLLTALFLALQTPPATADTPRARAAGEVQLARGWDDFPVFVWREKYKGKPLPAELADPFGGVILMRDEDPSWARERGLAYLVWNVAGRDALHLDADAAWNARVEQWIQTHDEKLLVRTPCLNDPATLAQLFTTLDATLARHADHPGPVFVLGDEVGLTPNGDPFDLCRCAFCEAKWKVYAQKSELPEHAPLTDEVLQGLTRGETSLLGAWLARRRFERENVEELMEKMVQHIDGVKGDADPFGRKHRSERSIGLLGCKGATPFGGVVLDRLATQLDFVECYPVDATREFVETVPYLWRHGMGGSFGPDPRPGEYETLFLSDESPAALAWQVWAGWLRGDNGLVLWTDERLAFLGEEQRRRLTEAIESVRSLRMLASTGPGRSGPPLPMWPSATGGPIALLSDPDSAALSFLRDATSDGPSWPRRRAGYQEEHGTRERKVRTWLRLLEDCGTRASSLPLSRLCDDCRNHFPVLILPEILVLDEGRIAQLERHVAAGGTLVVDGTLGWVDSAGRILADGVLERLRRTHPERVLTPPREMDDYLEQRWDPQRASVARKFARQLLSDARANVPPDPILSGESAAIPWLIGRCYVEHQRAFVVLPNCATPEERARHLRDLPLDVRAPPGETLTWIQPADGKVLRAGDAAVFVLTPE